MRKTARVTVLLTLVAAAIGAIAQAGNNASAAALIQRETDRLEQELKKKPDADPWKDEKADIGTYLGSARNAANAGLQYLALEQLGKARDVFYSLEALDANAKRDMPAFESDWKIQSAHLMDVEQKQRGYAWDGTPAVVRALAENEFGTVTPLLEASRAYAQVTAPEYGFLYLGQARAATEFADLCHNLNLPRPGEPIALRSIVPELQQLQSRVDAAFQPPRSIDRHSDFIVINSILKIAGEMDSSKLYFAAWYRYLQGLTQFGLLDTAVPNAAKQAELRRQIGDLADRLRHSAKDESIAQLFLQKAQLRLAADKPSDDDWRVVQIVAEQTLPAYFEARKTAAAPNTGPGQHLVTLTLVRWPYT